MEATATISLKEYNELKEFKQNMEQNNVVFFNKTYDGYTDVYALTALKAIEKIKKILNNRITELISERDKLKLKHARLRDKYNPINYELIEVKQMNYWEWRKWKKEQLTKSK